MKYLLIIIIILLLIIILFCLIFDKQFKQSKRYEDIEFRYKYYTNSLLMCHDKKKTIEFNKIKEKIRDFTTDYSCYWINYEKLEKNIKSCDKIIQPYIDDLYNIWKLLPSRYKKKDKKLIWYPHDRIERFQYPIIVKTRLAYDSFYCSRFDDQDSCGLGSIIFKLNTDRHFKDMLELKDKIPFDKKKTKLLWRGTSTGYGFNNNIPYRTVSRSTLIEKWGNKVSSLMDIALVHENNNRISIKEMLKYKYLLSVEGNDVASNLKWIMASNSVLFMPRPQITSWFMEDQLIPWYHYIPVNDDFSDLEILIKWANDHPLQCKKIINHCHDFVDIFKNNQNEIYLQKKILCWYLDSFSWQ